MARRSTRAKTKPEDVEEIEDIEEVEEEAPKPKKKTTRKKAKVSDEEEEEAPPKKKAAAKKKDSNEKGTGWLAEYVNEQLETNYKPYDLRIILRKMSKAGELERNVGEDRSRYTFSGPKDPVVVSLVAKLKDGALEKERKEKLSELKDKKSTKKKAKAVQPDEDEEVEDLEDFDEDDEFEDDDE